jgi:hypothetical protein
MQASISNTQVHVHPTASPTPAAEVHFTNREVFSLAGDQRGVQFESVRGLVWVTQPGDNADHWLRPGQTFVVSAKGQVVASGLPGSILRVA